ncbi:flagellar basal body rod protein FlgB [Dethiobacter alkaliphilus]|uniref:flagellar basal body rod protein FlgB n=1 Tax=Dethiobacter alkaliphilus TaxID=427926 RepID=UPI00222759D9|nr:flagellar basal body rod protein FlgB [Dethiobacter alkaliphilus]MCW3488751.1 flagellar basal body rod protein FlgB [Dethiobacter alkaliphilus]
MNSLWTDNATVSLQKGLDAAGERNRVMAHNVANVNTPMFKRQDVSFEKQLRQALAAPDRLPLVTTHERHVGGQKSLQDVGHKVSTDRSSAMRSDGNNVDIDREMALMATNQLNYNAMTQMLNERYSLMRYVIHEGRR